MNGSAARRQSSPAIHLMIFLAGFSFLIYEVSWNRLLSLVLGATVAASTIVLAAFMAGFGCGAWFWGRFANKRTGIARLLGALLGGVALLSAFDYFLFTRALPRLYAALGGDAGGSAAGMEALVFCLAALLLFAPAFLIGGVFPLASKLAVGRGGVLATSIGRLYALETLGSSLGGLAAGFIFLGLLGQWKTLALAILINLGLAAWLMIARESWGGGPAADPSTAFTTAGGKQAVRSSTPREGRADTSAGGAAAALRRSALLVAFVCGLVGLSLQVLWLRMFKIYLSNTSYSFALVSSIAILGLFAGSGFFQRRGGDVDDPGRSLLRVTLGMAITAGLGLLLLINLPEVLMFPFKQAMALPWVRVLLLPCVAALLVVFPPSVFSGYAFPLACGIHAAGRSGVSRDVGFVLMLNTVGAVLGPVAAAFLLLPRLGAARSVLLLIALLAFLAIYLMHRGLMRSGQTHRGGGAPAKLPARIALYAGCAFLLFVIVAGPETRILPPSFARFDRELLFYREAVEGTLSVGRDRGGPGASKYTFVNNSAVIGSTYDSIKVVKMVGHFPFFLGLDCRDVLVIGFGIGVTTSAIASHDEVETIDCVELAAGLRDAATHYRDLNQNVVDDPRLNIIPGDGRHYLQMTGRRYDLISCDPTHPIFGSGNLYTREYFTLCREHLKAGGMVSQYLPLHKLRPEEFLGLLRTFQSVFPHCSVWLGNYHAVLLAGLEPIEVDFADWAAAVEDLNQDKHVYIEPYHFAATLALDGERIAELGAASSINTDDLNYTEFFAPACLDAGNLAANLKFFVNNRVTVGTVFKNLPDPALMVKYSQGNRLLTESLYQLKSGSPQRSMNTLRQAARINPENGEYPFLLKLYF